MTYLLSGFGSRRPTLYTHECYKSDTMFYNVSTTMKHIGLAHDAFHISNKLAFIV